MTFDGDDVGSDVVVAVVELVEDERWGFVVGRKWEGNSSWAAWAAECAFIIASLAAHLDISHNEGTVRTRLVGEEYE